MNNVSGSFFVEMLIDGDSAQGNIRATRPLVQMYNPDTLSCIPDWGIAANQPIVYPVIRSGNEGVIKPIVSGTDKWYYNNTQITFNDAGLSTYPDNVVGKFQRITYNNGSVDVPAIKIIANLASGVNMDADTIRMDGQIEASGHNLSFSSDIALAISEYSDSSYTPFVYASNGGIIDEASETITLTQELYKGGEIVPQTKYTVQWYKLPSSDVFSTSNSITLQQGDIDSRNNIKCEFIIKGVVVTAYIQEVSDETDPYFLDVSWSGKTKLALGESVIGNTTVKKIGTGEIQSGFTFAIAMTDIQGNTFTPETLPTSEGTITITYADCQNAGGNITGYITATKTV